MRLVVVECSFLLLLLWGLVIGLSPGGIGDVTTPPSGCELCASTGDCSRAFRDGPGQFCGNWMDRSSHELPCCCPLKAVCNVSPNEYICTCAYVGAMPPYHSESDLMNRVLWMWWVIGFVVIIVACGACGYFVVKRMVNNNGERCTFVPPEVVLPLVSPSREALYGSTGQTETAKAGAGQTSAGIGSAMGRVLGLATDLAEEVPMTTHEAPIDDLDVGGDGFDGGLGSLEKVEEANEAESTDSGEAEEEVKLLTLSAKDTTT